MALRRTIMSTPRDGAKDAVALAVKCHVNSATCLSKLQRHSEAIAHADAALDLDATAVKAMYRKAVALEQQGRNEEALSSLRDALELSKDRAIREAFVRVRRRMNEVHEGEREVCARMVKTETQAEAKTRGFGARAVMFHRKRPVLASAIAMGAIAAVVTYFKRGEKSASSTTSE
jgi:tetratricopeptide (TPR) repeat protein